jgi:hypothetical protein
MRHAMIAACAALSFPTAALAQSGEWEYSASIDGWFAALETSVETPLGTVETELSFSDIWDDLTSRCSVRSKRDEGRGRSWVI